VCGYSRSGKSTLVRSICRNDIKYIPPTTDVVLIESAIESQKYRFNIYDTPGWNPDFKLNTFTEKIRLPIQAILVTLDITEVRAWSIIYLELRAQVKKIAKYCLRNFSILPVILLGITKFDLMPLEFAPFGRSLSQSWLSWKDTIHPNAKDRIWTIVQSIFGEKLFKRDYTFLLSIAPGMNNDYGVNEIIQLLDRNPYGHSKIEVLFELMKRNLDIVEGSCQLGDRVFPTMSSIDFSKETS